MKKFIKNMNTGFFNSLLVLNIESNKISLVNKTSVIANEANLYEQLVVVDYFLPLV